MDLYRFLRPIGSAPVARNRLQGLLEFERRLISQTDLLAVLRDEILTVVSRRVAIDPDEAQVWLDRGHASRRWWSAWRFPTGPARPLMREHS